MAQVDGVPVMECNTEFLTGSMRCESTRRLTMQKAIHPMETIMPNSVTEEQAGTDDWAAAMAEQAAAPS